tara:strand:+ start:636 stop:881 length:246 start_codon:yes stop_codon:yes gene_type:complete
MVKDIINGVVVEVEGEADSPYFTGLCEKARAKRNDLLTETDWWATSDRTMTAEQTAYRQALRDITDQAGFPTDITWPAKPE